MLPDLKLVVQLQELDGRVAELTKEVSSLPKHIAEIEKKLESHRRKLEADRAALVANQRDRKKFEGDIQIQEQKVSKLRGQMLEAKTNEQYRAFQHEIEFCEKEIHVAEDRILDLMSESEPLEKNVKAAEAALKVESAQVESEKKSARERTDRDKSKLDELFRERNSITAGLSPSLHSMYERLRKSRGGLAIAEAVDGRCSTCHLSMRLQFFQDLKRGEQVLCCESCGRILIYNPPVGFEDLTGAATPAARR